MTETKVEVRTHTAAESAAICDRMAEAMRRHKHGLIRPLWADMTDQQKCLWRMKSDDLIAAANRCGVYFERGPRHE